MHEHLSWSFLGQKVPYAMEMLCLLKIYNLCNENKGLIYGELMWRDTPFPKTWSWKYFLRPVTKVYVRETTIILCIFEFTKFSQSIAWALLFCPFLWEPPKFGSVKASNLSSTFLNRQGDKEETKWEVRCEKVI